MDLTVEHSLEDERRINGRERVTVAAVVANNKPEAVEIELTPAEAGLRGFRIVSSDIRAVSTSSSTPRSTARSSSLPSHTGDCQPSRIAAISSIVSPALSA